MGGKTYRQIATELHADQWPYGDRPCYVYSRSGGEIVRLFLEENLIDEYRVYIMPVLLGNGLPLFPKGFPKTRLSLESAKETLGIAELVYRRR